MKTIILICVLFLGLAVHNANAQGSVGGSGIANYVVVLGAFSMEVNASKFSKQVKKAKLQPQVELNKLKGLYYVYVLQTPDHSIARAEADRLRAGSFKNAWVFTGTVKELATTHVVEPVVEERPREVVPIVITEKPAEPVVVIDSTAIKAKMRDDHIREQVDKQGMEMKKGEMDRLDYIIFYRDASVLRPESRYEVDRLVKVMKANPKQKIRIHGHTNGNDPGKIIKRANANADFFSLDNTIEDYGSAKELSEQRAEVIRDYLIKNGIDKKRMSVKAWGGKKPLYNVDDAKAEANVRVEVEVLEN